MLWVMEDSTKYFYPRSPCGERLIIYDHVAGSKAISIHALLAESDGACHQVHAAICADFYPRSPCGERHSDAFAAVSTLLISIHALLAESDIA